MYRDSERATIIELINGVRMSLENINSLWGFNESLIEANNEANNEANKHVGNKVIDKQD